MAKCIRCGKSTLMRGHIRLKDADLCTPCFKELGFDGSMSGTDVLIAKNTYSWNDIKDGKAEYDRRRWTARKAEATREESERLGLVYADFQTLDDLDCSTNEIKTIEKLCALLEDERCKSRLISYEREPGGPLNAFVGDALLYQLRYTRDVKWIRIGADGDKVRITGPAGINKLVDKLVNEYRKLV